MERTLVLVKPDGVKRHLVGKIISRFEDAGLKIVAMKMVWADETFARKHYGNELDERYKDVEIKFGRNVRNELVKYLKEGPIVAMVLEGVECIRVVRKMVGATYPSESPAGTIRGDFAHVSKDFANANNIMVKNLIHASEDKPNADKEIALWFSGKEIHNHKTIQDLILHEKS